MPQTMWQISPMSHKTFVVHSLKHAEIALAVADSLGQNITLLSAANAAAFMGAGVFQEIAIKALAKHPEVNAKVILDCGTDAGWALNALRNGVKNIRLQAPNNVMKKVANIAMQQNASLDTGKENNLDLATVNDFEKACRTWLTKI